MEALQEIQPYSKVFEHQNIRLMQADCIAYMQSLPDNYYDLAIVDPEYGIDVANMNLGKGVGTNSRKWLNSNWDNKRPTKEYFEELFRVSKNQIIWGGNYFLDLIAKQTKCMLIWDKIQKFSGSDFEIAWTSFGTMSKAFRMSRVQAYTKIEKIHPTQKPVALYKWLLKSYGKSGDKIFDSHGGSMSIAIACYEMGFSLDCTELDADYYEAAVQRFKKHVAQENMFIQKLQANC